MWLCFHGKIWKFKKLNLIKNSHLAWHFKVLCSVDWHENWKKYANGYLNRSRKSMRRRKANFFAPDFLVKNRGLFIKTIQKNSSATLVFTEWKAIIFEKGQFLKFQFFFLGNTSTPGIIPIGFLHFCSDAYEFLRKCPSVSRGNSCIKYTSVHVQMSWIVFDFLRHLQNSKL